jgi:MinD-like ATPase involved in chromosome partitioning or flagellar assembly
VADLELALAASARDWSDSLHRFLTDHGGARVRAVVMGAEEVGAESFDVLIIDDVCSFLTPRLVEQVRRGGRSVVGVFDPRDGADAKRRLLDCGVDDVVETDATPEEFLAVVRRVRELLPAPPSHNAPAAGTEPSGRVIAIGAPPGGAGGTEVSIALAAELGALLIDADDLAPSIAQRLGRPLHPNLRTAIDVVHHRSGQIEDSLTTFPDFRLVAGLVSGEEWSQLHPGEVQAVVDEFAGMAGTVVANVASGLERPDLGEGRFGLARSLVGRADVVVGVGLAHPVGVTRLIQWMLEAATLAPDARWLTVVNRVPRSVYQRGEVSGELARALPGIPVNLVPEDPRVREAAWSGETVGRGPFRRAVRRLAREVGA